MGTNRNDWLKDSLDKLWEKVNEINDTAIKEIAEIKTTMKLMPPALIRPCRELTEHLESHKESKTAKFSFWYWLIPLVVSIGIIVADKIWK